MNKHIELVKKWLADPESVSLEELEANKEAAWAAAWAAYRGGVKANKAAYWAVRAAKAAEDATYWDAMAIYWRNIAIKHIEKYEELTK
jgi:hypothetical protein